MRETIFQDKLHTPEQSLATLVGDRLARYLRHGQAYTLIHEMREGKLYAALLDLGAGIAVQVWDTDTPLAELPEPAPEVDVPTFPRELDKDSGTDTVALWAKAQGLADAYVSGAWVWVDDSINNRLKAGDESGACLRALLTVNGFAFSRKRNGYFHKCGVEPRSERPTGRKLSAMHNTVPVGDFRPATYDPRPAWKQRETKKRRVA